MKIASFNINNINRRFCGPQEDVISIVSSPSCGRHASRRAPSTAMTKTDADCLRLLPDRRLGSFHRLRDLDHRCPCFRMGLELSQILFGPRIADEGLLFRHGFHSSLVRIDFGKSGSWYYDIARGRDDRSVQPDRERKSSGSETTFPEDLTDPVQIEAGVIAMADDVWAWCEKANSRGRTVTVKIKWADFQISTRSRSMESAIQTRHGLHESRPRPNPFRVPAVEGRSTRWSDPLELSIAIRR
jgi:impB/mucB/samB family C-terminal domain